MYLARQTFLILGISRSGKAAAEFLLQKNAKVYLYDDLTNDRLEQTMHELETQGAIRVQKTDLERVSEVCDGLVLSPGIPIDHPLAVAFKRAGKAVLGETELAARHLCCPAIAVTGTNGKTTVVSMIETVLNKGGLSAKACGNIGTPMVELCQAEEDKIAVAEISSFQMETLNSFCPHISVILNITEDHLNRHYTMENYIFLKAKLLKNATETEFAVLNYDDVTVRAFAEKTKAKVVYFSVREQVRGAFYQQGNLYFGKEKILAVEDLPIGGLHNVQNALAVIAVAKIMGISTAAIVEGLTDFKGVKHRLELVAKIDGVTYIDDSKGTNVDATIKAIAAMKEETVLLLGGKNKGYQYDRLFAALKKSKVIHAVLYGENRYTLLRSARENGYESVTICDQFDFAVRIAAMKAMPGQTVLLSPASASFDAFSSYEERGERFIEVIRAIHQTSSGKELCAREGRELDEGIDEFEDGNADDDFEDGAEKSYTIEETE